MWDIIRESTVGEILNRVSGGRILPYPDQRSDFVIPEKYLLSPTITPDNTAQAYATLTSNTPRDDRNGDMKSQLPLSRLDLPAQVGLDENAKSPQWTSSVPTRHLSSDAIHTTSETLAAGVAMDLEAGSTVPKVAEASPKALEKALEAAHTDYILVDWYSDDDPENPRNWSSGKRLFVLFEICLLT